MRRSMLSTYRFGLLTSAGGLGLLLAAVIAMAMRPAHVEFFARLRSCLVGGAFGFMLTTIGFALMQIGAVRSGEAFTMLDPARFSEDPGAESVDAEARAEITRAAEDETPSPRCLACANENRATARYCDQCGERL